MNAKNALGRGLDALLSTPGPEPRRVLEVEIHRLKANPHQPRARFEAEALEDLARSIKANGILQPILVRPANGKYEIIAGERRWRAAQKAGLQRVPVLVREAADAQMLELTLVENIQREDLNPVEEAHAYRVLIEDLNLSQEEVARRVGKERATVANTLRLLHLSQLALAALEAGQITTGHAKAILSHKKHEEQDELLEAILKRGLSVREAEAYHRRGTRRARHRNPVDADTTAAAERLAMEIGVPVEIRRKGRGGEVALRFRDEDELQGLFEKLHDLRGRGR